MSVWSQATGPAVSLFGAEGELVLLDVTIEPRLLEDLLEALAQLDFPINPELHHHSAQVIVEFPAYERRIDEVRNLLKNYGFDPTALQVASVLH